MRISIILLLALLITPGVCRCEDASKEDNPNRLTYTLESKKDVYFEYEPLRLTLKIYNPTSHSIKLPPYLDNEFELKIKQPKVNENTHDNSISRKIVRTYENIIIKPGEYYILPLKINDSSCLNKAGKWEVEYIMRGRIGDNGKPNYVILQSIFLECIPNPLVFPKKTPVLAQKLLEAMVNEGLTGLRSERPGWTVVNYTTSMTALLKIGKKAIPALIANIQNYKIQSKIIQLLGDMKAKEAVLPILQELWLQDGFHDSLIIAKLSDITGIDEGPGFHRRWFDRAVRIKAVFTYLDWASKNSSKINKNTQQLIAIYNFSDVLKEIIIRQKKISVIAEVIKNRAEQKKQTRVDELYAADIAKKQLESFSSCKSYANILHEAGLYALSDTLDYLWHNMETAGHMMQNHHQFNETLIECQNKIKDTLYILKETFIYSGLADQPSEYYAKFILESTKAKKMEVSAILQRFRRIPAIAELTLIMYRQNQINRDCTSIERDRRMSAKDNNIPYEKVELSKQQLFKFKRIASEQKRLLSFLDQVKKQNRRYHSAEIRQIKKLMDKSLEMIENNRSDRDVRKTQRKILVPLGNIISAESTQLQKILPNEEK